ncbi:DUF4286 family protein [soil metagenome]
MIIYNVTVNIDHIVAADWLQWMKEVHIPKVLATGMFLENKIFRLVGDEDSGGVTYAVQYYCESMDLYEEYKDKYAAALQADHKDRYKDQFVAFRTLLEDVS